MSYCIYKHTAPNGKVYIGQTKRKPEIRWANGLGYKKCVLFNRAIEKYGWENIKHEILYSGLDAEQANLLEEETISKFNSANPKYGYNLFLGGNNKEVTEIVKEHMRKNHANFKGENHPLYGKHHSKKSKERMSIAKKGKRTGYDSISGKCVLQIKNGEIVREWGSMRQASLELKIDHSGIAKACKGKQKSAGGFTWRYSK